VLTASVLMLRLVYSTLSVNEDAVLATAPVSYFLTKYLCAYIFEITRSSDLTNRLIQIPRNPPLIIRHVTNYNIPYVVRFAGLCSEPASSYATSDRASPTIECLERRHSFPCPTLHDCFRFLISTISFLTIESIASESSRHAAISVCKAAQQNVRFSRRRMPFSRFDDSFV
jgi:hypothetical protein